MPAAEPVLNNPTLAWSRPVRFDRHGDAARVGDVVLLAERVDVNATDGEVLLHRVDPSTGENLWTRNWTLPGSVNVHLLPTHETAVFSLVADGAIQQFLIDTANGDTIWSEGGPSERVGPRLLDDVVVFDTADGTAIVANRSDGVERWRTERDVRLIVRDGWLMALDVPAGRLSSRDPLTGDELWTAELGGRPAAPTISDGRIIVSVGSGDGEGDRLMSFDLATGNEQWIVEEDEIGNALKVPTRDVLIVSDLNSPASKLYGIRLADGEVLWQLETERPAIALQTIRIDGRAFVVAPDAGVDGLIDVATGEILASSDAPSGQSAAAAGAIYQSDPQSSGLIRGLRLHDLETMWELELGSRAWVFAAAGDAVLIMEDDRPGEGSGTVGTMTAYVEGDAGPE